jgi:hypothetical protein
MKPVSSSADHSHFYTQFSMNASTSSVFTFGAKNLITLPSELMKNLAKFQGITFAVLVLESYRELLFRRNANTGCVFYPFTSTFSIIGKLALKFF